MSLILSGALLGGCVAHDSGSVASAAETERSILARANPAPGSTVRGPVDELKLHFSPPARLDEVTVTGPQGTMPMMVHAIGEVADYSLPVADLEAGSYTVNWRASIRAQTYQGTFAFTVR